MFRLKNGAESGVRVEATIWIMGGVVATILMSCVFRRAFGCLNKSEMVLKYSCSRICFCQTGILILSNTLDNQHGCVVGKFAKSDIIA